MAIYRLFQDLWLLCLLMKAFRSHLEHHISPCIQPIWPLCTIGQLSNLVHVRRFMVHASFENLVLTSWANRPSRHWVLGIWKGWGMSVYTESRYYVLYFDINAKNSQYTRNLYQTVIYLKKVMNVRKHESIEGIGSGGSVRTERMGLMVAKSNPVRPAGQSNALTTEPAAPRVPKNK